MSDKLNNRLGKVRKLSRRQFLKNAGLLMGGAAISPLVLTTACGSSEDTTTSSTLPSAEGFVYKAPDEQPPKQEIPGCTTLVATDRKYIIEHMWIKMVAENIVVTGITEKMSELCDDVYSLLLPDEGSTINKGELLGSMEAAKINLQLVAPVSGTIRQIHHELWPNRLTTINLDPYVNGWLFTAELSNPVEMDELLTPQEYIDLNSKVTG